MPKPKLSQGLYTKKELASLPAHHFRGYLLCYVNFEIRTEFEVNRKFGFS